MLLPVGDELGEVARGLVAAAGPAGAADVAHGLGVAVDAVEAVEVVFAQGADAEPLGGEGKWVHGGGKYHVRQQPGTTHQEEEP